MDQIKTLVLISSISALAACGGGSGGSGEAQSASLQATGNLTNEQVDQVMDELAEAVIVASGVVTSSPNQAYDGVQAQMPTTEDNTRNLLQTAFADGALGSVQDLSKPNSSQVGSTQSAPSVFSTAGNLPDQVFNTINQNNKPLPVIETSKIDFDQTINCESGIFRAFGELENNGTGTLNMTLNNCRFVGVLLNGGGEFEISEFDIARSLITRGAIRFNNVSATSNSGPDFRLDGEESYVLDDNGSQGEVSSLFNLVVTEEGGPIVWFENFQERAIVNAFNQVDLTFSGRVHHSDLGYVDISTPTTIETQLIGGDFAQPDPGGELLFTGRNSGSVRFTTFSTGVTMDIDEDGDNTFEISVTLTYEEIGIF